MISYLVCLSVCHVRSQRPHDIQCVTMRLHYVRYRQGTGECVACWSVTHSVTHTEGILTHSGTQGYRSGSSVSCLPSLVTRGDLAIGVELQRKDGLVGLLRNYGMVGLQRKDGLVGLERNDGMVELQRKDGLVGLQRKYVLVGLQRKDDLVGLQRMDDLVGLQRKDGLVGLQRMDDLVGLQRKDGTVGPTPHKRVITPAIH